MDLDWSEEQQVLRDMVRGVCAQYAPLEVVRQMEDDATGYPAELWKQLGELGLTGLLIPEEYGGSGQGLLEAAIVYEELGRSLAPSPALPERGRRRRPAARGGERGAEAGVAAAHRLGRGDPHAGLARAGRRLRPGGRAAPRAPRRRRLRALGHQAPRALRLGRDAPRGARPHRRRAARTSTSSCVDPRAPGVTLTQQRSLASDTQYQVDLAGVRVAAADRIGAAGSGWRSFEAVMHDGIILLAALAMGGAERALEITVQYAKDRKQFDKPLGAFQAISHYLADAATAIDGGRTLVYEAAWARASGRPVERLAPMAKLFACQTWRDVTAMCQQVWGGVGFTIEYDIQLYFRRAKQLQITWWDTRTLEERVARTVLD